MGGRGSPGGRTGIRSVILPIVIREEERSIFIAQLQGRISQRIRHPKTSQARPDSTNDNPVKAAVATQDKARDHDVARVTDKGPSTYVGQFRVDSLVQVVNFDQSHTRSVIIASHDRGICSRVQVRHNHRVETARLAKRSPKVARIAVIVDDGCKSGRAVQLQHWIGQRGGH